MIAIYIFLAILALWWFVWFSVPCSSFKTNPVLRTGYAPARCVQ